MSLDLPHVRIDNDFASAVIVEQGAHVLQYTPRGKRPVLWHSASSHFELGRAIRGGIPVCWPWFAQHPTHPERPMHGIVRTMTWRCVDQSDTADGATQVRFELTDDETSRMHWPHRFRCELNVTVGAALTIALTHHNTDDKPVTCSGALHTYFAVDDVTRIKIHGLDGCQYIDKTDDFKRKTQTGPLTIDAETDSIYQNTADPITLEDPGGQRRIEITRTGSRSAIVWNPWIEKSKKMADFGDAEYPRMVCIEAANAGDDTITIPPGDSHTLATTIRV